MSDWHKLTLLKLKNLCWAGMNTRQTLAQYVLGQLTRAQIISFAEQLVCTGNDSESMIEVAFNSIALRAAELEQLFKRALVESDLSLPSKEQAVDDRFQFLLYAIAEGIVSPYKGAKAIYEEVYDEINGSELDKNYVGECLDISRILGAMYAYEDLQEPYIENEGCNISKTEADVILDGIIVSEARRLIANSKTKLSN